MKYIIRIKQSSKFGMLNDNDYYSYILYPYRSEVYNLTEDIFKAWPFDNETEANDYISQKVLMNATVLPITKEQYNQYLERGRL